MDEYIIRFAHLIWYLGNLAFCIRLMLKYHEKKHPWLFSLCTSMTILWVIFMVGYFI